jgi:hypothetical protein
VLGPFEKGHAIPISTAYIRLEVRLYFGDKKLLDGLLSWRHLIKRAFLSADLSELWVKDNANTTFYPAARYNLSPVHYPHRQLLIERAFKLSA